MNDSARHSSRPTGHALDCPSPEKSSALVTWSSSHSQNQKTCALQAGTQSGVISDTIIMTTKDITPTIEPRVGEPQLACPYQSSNQPRTEQEESGAIAVAPLSIAVSVDDTSLAPEPVQAELDECNLNKSMSGAQVPLPNMVCTQKAVSMDAGRGEQALNSASTNTGQPTASYPILNELIKLFGNGSVFIHVPSRTKAPADKGWQKTTTAQMLDPVYQARLAAGNIGVLLGEPSGGLSTVDIDSDGEFARFIQLNPILSETLITRGARGGQLWFRMKGDYPPLTKLKNESGQDYGEWRADGGQSIVHGTHPSGVPYKRLNDAPPLTIRFDQIVWPDHVKLPWVKDAADQLTDQYGPAYKFESGLKINEFYFAAKFKLEHPVLWDPTEREFYRYDTLGGLWHCVSTENLKFQLGIDFKHASDQTGIDDFVFARNDARMSACLSTLKMIGIRFCPVSATRARGIVAGRAKGRVGLVPECVLKGWRDPNRTPCELLDVSRSSLNHHVTLGESEDHRITEAMGLHPGNSEMLSKSAMLCNVTPIAVIWPNAMCGAVPERRVIP